MAHPGPASPSPKDPAAELRATLVLRRPKMLADSHGNSGKQSVHCRNHPTHSEFAAEQSALAADVRTVRAFARTHGLQVEEVQRHSRLMLLSGPAAAMRQVFAASPIQLHASAEAPKCKAPASRSFASTASGPDVPAALAGAVDAVFGISAQPGAVRRGTHWRSHKQATPAKNHLRNPALIRAKSALSQPSITDLEQAYGFPPGTDGKGQCIAILEFGGGYRREDLQRYFLAIERKLPRVTDVLVDGAKNDPAPDALVHRFFDVVEGKRPVPKAGRALDEIESAQCTVEVTMDLQLAGALAPGAHLLVYFGLPTEQGIVHTLSRAIHGAEARRHKPSVIAISWGEAEPSFSEPFTTHIDGLLQDAARLGITVCASSGDGGSRNSSPDGKDAVNFPASSPYCLGCGGTTAKFAADQLVEERVWNAVHHGIPGATGGGVSRRFALPAWQRDVPVPANPLSLPGRGVPDVAGPADPARGPMILVAGRAGSAGGTSAVVPFWAALVARFNQALHRLEAGARCGYLNPLLYRLASKAGGQLSPFRPILRGGNGGYVAGPGWNPCTGFGSPIGEKLFAGLVPRRPAR